MHPSRCVRSVRFVVICPQIDYLLIPGKSGRGLSRNPASIFFLSRILSNFRLRLVKLSQAPHDYLMREVTVTEAGYAYIFVSNENPEQVDVHFDDVKITHTHSNIVVWCRSPSGCCHSFAATKSRRDERYSCPGFQARVGDSPSLLIQSRRDDRFPPILSPAITPIRTALS